jgi:hypothetical protein
MTTTHLQLETLIQMDIVDWYKVAVPGDTLRLLVPQLPLLTWPDGSLYLRRQRCGVSWQLPGQQTYTPGLLKDFLHTLADIFPLAGNV